MCTGFGIFFAGAIRVRHNTGLHTGLHVPNPCVGLQRRLEVSVVVLHINTRPRRAFGKRPPAPRKPRKGEKNRPGVGWRLCVQPTAIAPYHPIRVARLRGWLNARAKLRVGNTPWFRRVRWALCSCCLHRPLARKLVVADTNADAALLHAWRWAEPPARLPQENQETHKPEQNPGHLSISAFRSASLRFTTTTTTLRPPGAYRAMSHGACCLLW